MAAIDVRPMDDSTKYFVSTCSHTNESAEIDACGRRRCGCLACLRAEGARVDVGFFDGEPVGFIYLVPIEAVTCGPIGRDLAVIPCLWVLPRAAKRGLGRMLVERATDNARQDGRKGIATVGYYGDFWFMPAAFFESLGFVAVRRREKEAILWRTFDPSAEEPEFIEPRYRFAPVTDRVVVDLFWCGFCETSDIEAERVREVATEFGERVVLNEYCAEDRDTFLRYRISRAIFVNGKRIDWGYEAPREGIRAAISAELDALGGGG